MKRFLILVMLVAGAGGAASADEPPSKCSTPEYRHFDFWIGEWEVTRPDGKVAGHNTITAILDGCALREEWRSARGGFRGTSTNAYEAASGRWHQTWVDNQGTVLRIEGEIRDGAMVLENDFDRITWTPAEDGSVRQHWERTGDGGSSWSTVFDGTYRRVTKP